MPAPSYVAPSGYGVPGHTVARMGPVSGFVSLEVITRPYRRTVQRLLTTTPVAAPTWRPSSLIIVRT